jgi:hypothetical protein
VKYILPGENPRGQIKDKTKSNPEGVEQKSAVWRAGQGYKKLKEEKIIKQFKASLEGGLEGFHLCSTSTIS